MSTFAIYNRLNVNVFDSPRCVIRAARRRLHPSVRNDREWRASRHFFYRTMLEHHDKALELYTRVVSGSVH